MLQPRTSVSDPLRIDSVVTPEGGRIGMTFMPGRVQSGSSGEGWARDLAADLDAIRDWGAVAVVSLNEGREFDFYQVHGLGEGVRGRGMAWYHLPVADYDVPGPDFEAGWRMVGPALCDQLRAGRRILLHCLGGLGRTGTVAALLLAACGIVPDEAIAAVRTARPGTIETAAQEAYARRGVTG